MSKVSNGEITFTVFTPTYKRADVLPRLYNSLQNQTGTDFEWVIIDDHSDDGTQDLAEQWQQEAAFPVRFKAQDGDYPGKHNAVNEGVELSKGTFFYIVDSDDELLPDTLETLHDAWMGIPEADRGDYSGVAGLCIDEDGGVLGDPYPSSPFDSDIIETRYRYKLTGAKTGMVRTDILREHPFPRLDSVRHIPESLVWDAIAERYQTRFINEDLMIYHTDGDGAQLTTDGDVMKSSMGHVLCRRNRLNNQLEWMRYAPLEFIKSGIQYGRHSRHSGRTFRNQLSELQWPAHVLWAFCLPVAEALAFKDRRQVR